MKKGHIFLLVLSLMAVTYSAQVCFLPRDSFAVASTFIVSADFNSDGKKDLASTNSNLNIISVLLGTGTGSFGAATSFSVGANPLQLIIDDFNGDGKADLAVANAGSTYISVLLGNGSGGFSSITNYTVGVKPYYLVSADFNSDGIKDIITTNFLSYNVSLLLGDGVGGFGSANVIMTLPASNKPCSIITEDFNRDGKNDIAVGNCTAGTTSIYLGTGTGSFGSAVSTFGGLGIECSDFNEDTIPDLVANTSVWLGTGTGTFSLSSNIPLAGQAPDDYNGDGHVDLVLLHGNNTISVVLGDGTGNFGSALGSYAACYAICEEIISADFNGDTMPDLAVASNDIGILLNCTPVGIKGFSKNEEIKIYPNPATNSITIGSPALVRTENSIIKITDISGREVKNITLQITNEKKQIDVSDLKEGIYFVSVKTLQGASAQKIIVQR